MNSFSFFEYCLMHLKLDANVVNCVYYGKTRITQVLTPKFLHLRFL